MLPGSEVIVPKDYQEQIAAAVEKVCLTININNSFDCKIPVYLCP